MEERKQLQGNEVETSCTVNFSTECDVQWSNGTAPNGQGNSLDACIANQNCGGTSPMEAIQASDVDMENSNGCLEVSRESETTSDLSVEKAVSDSAEDFMRR